MQSHPLHSPFLANRKQGVNHGWSGHDGVYQTTLQAVWRFFRRHYDRICGHRMFYAGTAQVNPAHPVPLLRQPLDKVAGLCLLPSAVRGFVKKSIFIQSHPKATDSSASVLLPSAYRQKKVD